MWKENQDSTTKDTKRTVERSFKTGTVVGMLIDLERGEISYYKDGEFLGIAVKDKKLKNQELYPII